MIQPRDLRIGNWVNDAFSGHIQVRGIDIAEWESINALPIPLTEEWLLKFGFTIGGSTDTYFQKDDPEILIEKAKGTFYFSWESDWGANNELEVRHVHQLQNLIFALTGTELELKKENV